MELTYGHLLGGRLSYAQPRQGFPSGIEPVLLAASAPARPGEWVLEGGAGAGASLMCLAARVEGLLGIGLERDPTLAALARNNAASNGQSIGYVAGSVEQLPVRGPFDHAFANPPYHPESGTTSPIAERDAAKRSEAGLFMNWARALAAALKTRGTLTFMVAAASLPACLAAFAEAECGSTALFPLWPREGEAAKLLLLQGVKGGKGPCRILSGLTLHSDQGQFTPEANAVLRHGLALAL